MSRAHPALPPLPWLRSFEAAARRASFTAAAAELGLTQAAISQQIRLLEEYLGRRLFERLPRGVALTAEGAAYLPHVELAFAQLAGATRDLFGGEGRSRVLLRTPVSFAALWLAPRLALLAGALPAVRLEVATVHLPADYGGEEGLDVRYGAGIWSGRQSWRLTSEALLPVAAPALASGEGWRSAPRLSVVGARETWSEWFRLEGQAPVTPVTELRFDSYLPAQAAAEAGAGVLLGSRPLVDRVLAEGRLGALSAQSLAGLGGHFVTRAEGRRSSPAEDAVLAWLRREAMSAA